MAMILAKHAITVVIGQNCLVGVEPATTELTSMTTMEG
jgi:hypothetical protein